MNTATDDPTTVTVLVTGIGGFLAGHIALQLLEQGYRVRGSLRRISKGDAVQSQLGAQTHKDALERLSFVQADLDGDDSWTAAVEGCSYVIHTASPFPRGFPKMRMRLSRQPVTVRCGYSMRRTARALSVWYSPPL